MRNKFGWGLMTILSLLIVLVTGRYLRLNPDDFFPEQKAVYMAHQLGIWSHVLGGVLALGLGPFQFLVGLRTKYPVVHRWLGRGYLLGVLLGGVAGLYMATYAYTGAVAGLGFATLALIWLITGFMAYVRIRQGDVQAHRRWIIRNFALTFGAVVLRLQLGILGMFFDFETAYMIGAWSAWIPNLIIVEWFLNRPQPVVRRRAALATLGKNPVEHTS